jgi:hypothetical protein
MDGGNLWRNSAKKSKSGAEVSNLKDNISTIIAEGRWSPRSGRSRRAYAICHFVLPKAFLISWYDVSCLTGSASISEMRDPTDMITSSGSFIKTWLYMVDSCVFLPRRN